MTSNYSALIGAGLSIPVKICLGSDNIFKKIYLPRK
jgi:hypothetical protein